MAKRFYADVAGGVDLDLTIDPRRFNKTIDTDRLAVIVEFQALSDAARTEVGICKSFASLADYDTALKDESDEISDRLDYYTLYSNRTENLTVRDGAWFSPDSVNSFCGETAANVATNSIDGLNTTFWRHVVNHRHSIVYQLRPYAKKITKIRFFYNTSLPVNEQLSNLDIRAAKVLAKIDDPESLIEAGVNITWPGTGGVFVEHTLAAPKANAVFIKLEFDTASGVNTGQIREFEVFVTTRNP